MNVVLKALAWNIVRGLPLKAGAKLANLLYRDRTFGVDDDGDWICIHSPATGLASPDAYGQKLASIERQTREYFLPFYEPRPQHVVVDVGAGIGEEALTLSPKVARILAIEAHPQTFRCLQKTIALSGLANVQAVQCAVSDRTGILRISTERNHLANSVGSGSGVDVPARPLSDICSDYGIRTIDFLKVNIEGAERMLIEGVGGLAIRTLAIACHDFVAERTGDDFFRTKAIIRHWLDNNGYEVRTQQSDKPWIAHTLYARLK